MMLFLIAIALMVLIAWVALRAAELDHEPSERPAPAVHVPAPPGGADARDEQVVAAADEPAVDVTASPRGVEAQPAVPGQEELAVRVGVPHGHADPDRLIQTEILLADDARTRTLAALRLVVGVVGFGVALGLVILLFSRWFGALLS
jgi:hypothetical protein